MAFSPLALLLLPCLASADARAAGRLEPCKSGGCDAAEDENAALLQARVAQLIAKEEYNCNPNLTSPPQFCRDGTKCSDLPGCDSSMTICACPPASAALIAKKEEYNCNPNLTSPPQFCRDGTKCSDLPGCDSSMTVCACPDR